MKFLGPEEDCGKAGQGAQFGAEPWVFLWGIGPSRRVGLACQSPALPWGAEGKSPVGDQTLVCSIADQGPPEEPSNPWSVLSHSLNLL